MNFNIIQLVKQKNHQSMDLRDQIDNFGGDGIRWLVFHIFRNLYKK